MPLDSVKQNSLGVLCHVVSDVVVALDDSNRVTLFNPAAEAAFRVTAVESIGRLVDDVPALAVLKPALAQAAAESVVVERLMLPDSRSYRAQVLDVPEIGRVAILQLRRDDAGNRDLADLRTETIHELQTPIATAKMALNMVPEFGPLMPKQSEFTHKVHRSLDHMLMVVRELVDMTWLETSGRLILTRVDLNYLIERALEPLHDVATRQAVQVEFVPVPGGCPVVADERRLKDAITNLASNAIKYSPNGGTVRIRVEPRLDDVSIYVEDRGIGIPAEYIPRIFEWFYRVKSPETQRIEGSGLGLAIVKAIVEKHGGSVLVDSMPGRGSTFWFTIPRRPLGSSN